VDICRQIGSWQCGSSDVGVRDAADLGGFGRDTWMRVQLNSWPRSDGSSFVHVSQSALASWRKNAAHDALAHVPTEAKRAIFLP